MNDSRTAAGRADGENAPGVPAGNDTPLALLRASTGDYITDDPRDALKTISRESASQLWLQSGTIIRVSEAANPPYVLLTDPRGRVRVRTCATMSAVRDLLREELRGLGANPDLDIRRPVKTAGRPAPAAAPNAPRPDVAAREER